MESQNRLEEFAQLIRESRQCKNDTSTFGSEYPNVNRKIYIKFNKNLVRI